MIPFTVESPEKIINTDARNGTLSPTVMEKLAFASYGWINLYDMISAVYRLPLYIIVAKINTTEGTTRKGWSRVLRRQAVSFNDRVGERRSRPDFINGFKYDCGNSRRAQTRDCKPLVRKVRSQNRRDKVKKKYLTFLSLLSCE